MQIEKSLWIVFSIGLISLASPLLAETVKTPKMEALDQAKVHDLYNNGDFDPVLTVMESFMQRNKTYSKEDSIFLAKHLAVIYSANPATREKGKYYMFRLLELLPSAKLVDMFVSDEVDRIFDKVKEEFKTRQKAFGIDPDQMSLPTRPKPNPEPGVKVASQEKSHVLLWSAVAGGTVLLATGGYLWYQFNGDAAVTKPEPLNVNVITPKN